MLLNKKHRSFYFKSGSVGIISIGKIGRIRTLDHKAGQRKSRYLRFALACQSSHPFQQTLLQPSVMVLHSWWHSMSTPMTPTTSTSTAVSTSSAEKQTFICDQICHPEKLFGPMQSSANSSCRRRRRRHRRRPKNAGGT